MWETVIIGGRGGAVRMIIYKEEVGVNKLVTWISWRAMQAALVAILYFLTTIAEAQVHKLYS